MNFRDKVLFYRNLCAVRQGKITLSCRHHCTTLHKSMNCFYNITFINNNKTWNHNFFFFFIFSCFSSLLLHVREMSVHTHPPYTLKINRYLVVDVLRMVAFVPQMCCKPEIRFTFRAIPIWKRPFLHFLSLKHEFSVQ